MRKNSVLAGLSSTMASIMSVQDSIQLYKGAVSQFDSSLRKSISGYPEYWKKANNSWYFGGGGYVESVRKLKTDFSNLAKNIRSTNKKISDAIDDLNSAKVKLKSLKVESKKYGNLTKNLVDEIDTVMSNLSNINTISYDFADKLNNTNS